MLRLRRSDSIRSRSRGPLRAEHVALVAVADVELVSHDRIEQRVGAEQQLAVDDGVQSRIRRDVIGAATVPTQSMAVFGFHGGSALIIMGVEALTT
jgi:hypothetical protein